MSSKDEKKTDSVSNNDDGKEEKTLELHIPKLVEVEDSQQGKKKAIVCSCGIKCGSRELYYHHLECMTYHDKNAFRDNSQWPIRLFKTVPNVKYVQRGVIARNSTYDYIQYTVIWFEHNVLQNGKHSILLTNNNKCDDQIVGKFRHFISSVPLLTLPEKNQEPTSSCVIALSHTLWNDLITIHNSNKNKTTNLGMPNDLELFQNKHSFTNQQLLFPIYDSSYEYDAGNNNDKKDNDKKDNDNQENDNKDNNNNNNNKYKEYQSDILFVVKSNQSRQHCNAITSNFLKKLKETNVNIAHQESIDGFAYEGGKDLTGFIDGTKNMDYNLRCLAEDAIVAPYDSRENVGGSYVYCSRFIHDLTKFGSLSLDEKSGVIGRKYAVEVKSTGYDGRIENPRTGIDLKGHIFRGWGQMYRQSYPFIRKNKNIEEKGLFFTAFSHNISELINALLRMCGKWDQGNDNLFKITRSLYNSFLYAPSLHELQSLSIDNEEIKKNLDQIIDLKLNEKESQIIMPDVNYTTDKTVEYQCGYCQKKKSFLTDDHSDILFCFDCRNVTLKSLIQQK